MHDTVRRAILWRVSVRASWVAIVVCTVTAAVGCPRSESTSRPPLVSVPVQTTLTVGLQPSEWAAERKELAALQATAITHHRERRWTEAIAGWREVVARAPDHAGGRYNLACALTQAGDLDAAVAELMTLARMQVALPIAGDPELAPLHTHAQWAALLGSMTPPAFAVNPRHRSTAVALPDFFAEGLAVDGDTMYFGGIVDQSIAKLHGAERTRFAATPGQWSVFGLAIDSDRKRLWAAAAAVPQGRVVPSANGDAGLFALDLADGRQLGEWLLHDGGAHLFGDLAIAPDGTVFTTDTLGGSVHAVSPKATALRTVVAAGTLPSPQGIVVFDRDTLLVADYSAGLVAIELGDDGTATTMRTLPPPADSTLRGVDGLALHGTTLAAVRNGIAPWAVLRVELAADASAIDAIRVWHHVDPEHGEPTLVTDGGDALHVVQTDRWDRVFDREGRPRTDVAIAPPHVVSIPWSEASR